MNWKVVVNSDMEWEEVSERRRLETRRRRHKGTTDEGSGERREGRNR